MKKLVLSMALLTGLAIVSCSKDDDGGGNSDCVTCAAFEMMGQTMPATEICKAENGNAIIDGEEGEGTFEEAVQAMEMMTTCE